MSPATVRNEFVTGGKSESKGVSTAKVLEVSRSQFASQAPRNHGVTTAHPTTIPVKLRTQFTRGPSPLGDQTRSVTASQLRVIEATADSGSAASSSSEPRSPELPTLSPLPRPSAPPHYVAASISKLHGFNVAQSSTAGSSVRSTLKENALLRKAIFASAKSKFSAFSKTAKAENDAQNCHSHQPAGAQQAFGRLGIINADGETTIQQPVAKRPSNLASAQQETKSTSRASLTSNESFITATVGSSNDGFPDIPAPVPPAVATALVADVSNDFCDMAIAANDDGPAVQDSPIDITIGSEHGASCQSSKPGGDIIVLDAPDLVTISMETEVPISNSSITQLTNPRPGGSRGEIPSIVDKETIQAGSATLDQSFQPCGRSSSSNGLLCCCSGFAAARNLLMISLPVSPVDDTGYWQKGLAERQVAKQPSSDSI